MIRIIIQKGNKMKRVGWKKFRKPAQPVIFSRQRDGIYSTCCLFQI